MQTSSAALDLDFTDPAILAARAVRAILDQGRLFFKTDPLSAHIYTDCGMGPFTYEAKGKTLTMSYHEVPPEVLESAPELVDWARLAIRVAAKKPKKSAAKK